MPDVTGLLGPMRPWVEAQIAAGRFATEADAVQAALTNLAAQDARIANLQHLVQVGLDAVAAGDVRAYENADDLVADVLGKRF